jgi:hypothetical protein
MQRIEGRIDGIRVLSTCGAIALRRTVPTWKASAAAASLDTWLAATQGSITPPRVPSESIVKSPTRSAGVSSAD